MGSNYSTYFVPFLVIKIQENEVLLCVSAQEKNVVVLVLPVSFIIFYQLEQFT